MGMKRDGRGRGRGAGARAAVGGISAPGIGRNGHSAGRCAAMNRETFG